MNAGSFSGAAREANVTVQAVSKAIGELEAELGEPLFVRRSKGAVPTAFGLELSRSPSRPSRPSIRSAICSRRAGRMP